MFIGEVEILGLEYHSAYKPIIDGNNRVIGILYVGIPKITSEAMIKSHSNEQWINLAIIIMIILIISIISIYFMSKSFTKPIIHISEEVEKMGRYDLTLNGSDRLEKLAKGQDEIGTMASSVASLQVNLRDILESLGKTSANMAEASEHLSTTSEQSSLASDEVARTTDEIVRGASDQALDTENASIKVDEIGKLIAANEDNISELNDSAVEIDKQKEDGFAILNNLVKTTEENMNASKEVFEIIRSTNDNAHRIERASGMIQSIADQTNLLALNAAIESARAGEAGRGFAVVAEEIRKLAEESTGFAKEINDVIDELKARTEEAVTTMEKTEDIVLEQGKGVNDTRDKFNMIALAIEDTKKNINTISDSESEISTKIDELIGIVQNLSAIAEENAAGTEESSAAIEEQTAGMQEIVNSSEHLAEMAEGLNILIGRFKI